MALLNEQLNQLIEEQTKDKEGRIVFPERIVPRRAILFNGLPLRERACFILSLFMPRREIASILRITTGSVTQYRKRALKRLPEKEVLQYRRILSQANLT